MTSGSGGGGGGGEGVVAPRSATAVVGRLMSGEQGGVGSFGFRRADRRGMVLFSST